MILKDSYYYSLYVIHEAQREKATCPEPYSNYWDWKLSRGVSDSKAHVLIHYQLLSSAKGLWMSPLYKYNSVRYTCQIPTMLKRCHFACFSNLMKTWENNHPHYLHLSEEETEDEKVRQFVQKQSQTMREPRPGHWFVSLWNLHTLCSQLCFEAADPHDGLRRSGLGNFTAPLGFNTSWLDNPKVLFIKDTIHQNFLVQGAQ